MSIPRDWDDFADMRAKALAYHANTSLDSHSRAWNWFELCREFYQVKGFPKRERNKTGKNKGKLKPLSKEFVRQHEEERQKWIKDTASLKGFKIPDS